MRAAIAPPAPPALIVSAGLVGGGPARSGAPATITGHALGARPLERLEVWAGDQRIAELDSTSGAPALHGVWEWIPERVGPAVLFIRAVDDLGRMATSNAVRVDVIEGPGGSGRASVSEVDVGAARLIRASGASGLGSQSRAPLAALRRPAAPPVTTSAAELAPPTLTATLDGCALTLSVGADTDTADGLGLFVLGPTATSFTRAAALPLDQPTTTLPAPAGLHLIAGSAWDGETELLSAPVAVQVPDACGSDGWEGDVRLVSGTLHVPEPVDRGYAYVTVDGLGPAMRIPQDPNAFLTWSGEGLDAGPFLPALDGQTLALEAWGWQTGELVFLGTGTYTAPPAGGQGSGTGEGGLGNVGIPGNLGVGAASSLYWIDQTVGPWGGCAKEFCPKNALALDGEIQRPAVSNLAPIERTFRWTALQPGVTAIAWQVLPYSPPSSPNLAPPFLVDAEVIGIDPGTSSGEFVIDFRPYLPGGINVPDLADDGPPPDNVLQPIFPGQGGGPDAPAEPATMPTPKPTTKPGGDASAVLPNPNLQPAANQFWVRIIPIHGANPGIPSNPVRFDIVDPDDPIQIDTSQAPNPGAHTIQWSFEPPKPPDPKFVRCAIVVDLTDDFVAAGIGFVYQNALKTGEPLCYDPPDEGWDLLDAFTAFVEWVADTWDFVTEAYVWIKKQIVDAVLVAVPCSEIASDDVCTAVAEAALDGALMAAGIPPSLPDFGTVVEAAKGDLATLVVDLAADQVPLVGDVCAVAGAAGDVTGTKDCTALAKDALDKMVAQVEAQQSKAAGEASGWGWPGVVLKPDPRGLYHPPRISFTVTRTGVAQIPDQCSIAGSMVSEVKQWKHEILVPGKISMVPAEVTTDVKGEPFLPVKVAIPALEPGHTYSRDLLLTDSAGWYESNDSFKYWYYYKGLGFVDRGWVLMQQGALLTFKLAGNCSPTVDATTVLTNSAFQ